MSQDRYDEVEERQRLEEVASRQLGHILNLSPREEPTTPTTGRRQGRTGSADAGSRTPEEPPREPSAIEKFRDLLIYGPDDAA